MRIVTLLVMVIVSLGSAVGCTTSSGEWNKQGFEEKTYGWKAGYPAGQTRLLGAAWQLDNWYDDSGALVAKDGPKYVAILEEDEDRDGKIDSSETRKVFVYDLKYVNARDNGVIWVQTRTMHPLDAYGERGRQALEETVGGAPRRLLQRRRALRPRSAGLRQVREPAGLGESASGGGAESAGYGAYTGNACAGRAGSPCPCGRSACAVGIFAAQFVLAVRETHP